MASEVPTSPIITNNEKAIATENSNTTFVQLMIKQWHWENPQHTTNATLTYSEKVKAAQFTIYKQNHETMTKKNSELWHSTCSLYKSSTNYRWQWESPYTKSALASKFLVRETSKTKMSDDQDDLSLIVSLPHLATDTIQYERITNPYQHFYALG